MSTTWPGLISALLEKQNLSADETRWAMSQIMSDDVTGVQIAGLVVALRAKGETAEEVRGFADAMLDVAEPLAVDGPSLDIVGTGGDMAATVNISTMSAVVAAAAGARVVKHGNRAATSKCGSADVLTALGVKIDLPAAGVARCVQELGIGFAFAPVFHPAMRFAGPARKELGVPTVFNILGPLANPARPTAQMVGCANLHLAPIMADVLAARGTRSLVVRGADGLDEVTIFSDTEVWDATSGGAVRLDRIAVGRMLVNPAGAEDLKGGTADLNARIAREVFAGEKAGPLQAVRDAVVLNTAASLVAWDSIDSGAACHIEITERVLAAMPRAVEAIDSGRTTDLLDRWSALSQQAA